MAARMTDPFLRKPKTSGTLGEALETFLRTSGIWAFAKHRRLHQVWEDTVGPEIAAQARVLSLRRGVLEIAVHSSALMNDLQFHTAALLEDLRKEIKRPFISRISFVLSPGYQDENHEHE